MKRARMLGNYVQHLMTQKNLSNSDLMQPLNCSTEYEVQAFLKGQILASYQQISELSKILSVSIQELLAGDSSVYNKTVVHCMHEFKEPEKREEILDIIDDYVDIVDATNN